MSKKGKLTETLVPPNISRVELTLETRLPAATPPSPASPASAPKKFRVEELDGLRGLAALFAITHHYVEGLSIRSASVSAFDSFLQVIPLTLDTFFVLSGFLIGSILLRSKDSPNYYSTFYRRRFLRILPLYYVWVAFYFVLLFTTAGWGLKRPAGHSTVFVFVSFLFLFQNFFPTIFESGFIVTPTWTLAVEEHFYLLAPLCIRRFSTRRLVLGLSGIVVLSPLVRALIFRFIGHGSGWSQTAVHTWSICHADALALGVLLAIGWTSTEIREWLHQQSRFLPWLMLGFTVEGSLLLYMNWAKVPYTFTLMESFGRSGMALSCLCLMIFVLTRSQSLFCGLLRTRFLREAGKISYCLYLIHWGILWMISRFVLHARFGDSSARDLVAALVALPLSYVISMLSWRFLETPLISRAHRYRY